MTHAVRTFLIMNATILRKGVVLVCVGLASGCGSDGGVGPEPPAPRPTSLAFLVPPSRTEGTVAISPAPRIAIQDANGSTVTTAGAQVTVALADGPEGATLSGTTTVSATAGIATFADLRIDQPGTYSLLATSSGLSQALSTEFRIVLTIRTVDAGDSHTCAVTVADATYCWGQNYARQLAYDTPIPFSRAAAVAGMPSGVVLESLSLGSAQSCGRATAGEWYCWGQRMYETLSASAAPHAIPAIDGGNFLSVEANWDFSCGVATSGDAYCWGWAGYEGRLGDGTTEEYRLTPTRVLVQEDVRFRRLSSGYDHTCGITDAEQLYCWGWSVGPTPSLFAIDGAPELVDVEGGLAFMCALSSAGTIYCWGDNMLGQLGHGTSVPTHVPTAVVGENGRYTELAVGGEHACGVTTDGAVYCWGKGDQLGNGTVVHSNVPLLVSMPAGVRFVEIAAGSAHSCAVSDTRSLYCWGDNHWGQLGVSEPDGPITMSAVPIEAFR